MSMVAERIALNLDVNGLCELTLIFEEILIHFKKIPHLHIFSFILDVFITNITQAIIYHPFEVYSRKPNQCMG